MKLSQYNLVQKIENNTVIYNTLSAGILVLNKEYSEKYNTLSQTNNFENLDEELKNALNKGKMILADEIDELELVQAHNNLQRFDENNLALTIAPTLACNFQCPYCYERGRDYHTMNEDITAATISYINEHAKNTDNLSIMWYGGEPLLAVDVIENITKGIENKANLHYRAGIVTNGYLLNKAMALKLKHLNITEAQITIDGPPEIHNKRRKLPNGEDTFFTIFKNIAEVCDLLSITIRVNVDKENINNIEEILDYLDKYALNGKVGFYLAPVDNINGTCNVSTCFNSKEFSKEQMNFMKKNFKRGYVTVNIPHYTPGICCAISKTNIIIDPLGDIYKCWNEIGDHNSKVGNIKEGISLNSNYMQWINYDFLTDTKCKKCKLLPICLGGCPYKYIKTGKRECHPMKYKIKELVELKYKLTHKENSFSNEVRNEKNIFI